MLPLEGISVIIDFYMGLDQICRCGPSLSGLKKNVRNSRKRKISTTLGGPRELSLVFNTWRPSIRCVLEYHTRMTLFGFGWLRIFMLGISRYLASWDFSLLFARVERDLRWRHFFVSCLIMSHVNACIRVSLSSPCQRSCYYPLYFTSKFYFFKKLQWVSRYF